MRFMITTLSEIEHGVLVPPAPRKKGQGYIQVLLKTMRPGDSFVVSGDKIYSGAQSVRLAAKSLGIKTTQRKLDDGTIRVWRVE